MTLSELLKKIEELDREATRGPWKRRPGTRWPEFPQYITGPKLVVADVQGHEEPGMTKANAELLALSRTALPLLAEALETALVELRAVAATDYIASLTARECARQTVVAIESLIAERMKDSV